MAGFHVPSEAIGLVPCSFMLGNHFTPNILVCFLWGGEGDFHLGL